MTTPRMMFPTLNDVPPARWPVGLRVAGPDPTIGGSETEVRCPSCMRFVPPRDCYDFRELPSLVAHGLAAPIACRGCFHLQAHRGDLLHSVIARALGMHGAVVASLESGERQSLARGWHATTARNKHLAP